MDDNAEIQTNCEVENLSTESFPSISPKYAFMAFSLVLLLLVYIASYFQHRNFVSGVLITEFGIVLSIPVLFCTVLKLDITSTFRLYKVSIKNIFLSLGILIFSLPLIGIINLIFTSILTKIFGRIELDSIPIAQSIPELLLFFLLIGGTAGICEEILFRGFIMRSLERLGGKSALLISSILFGMLHLKLEKLPATILLGLIIGFAVYRTNSIFTGMILHFTNNSLATLLSFVYEKIGGPAGTKASTTYLTNSDILSGSLVEKMVIFVSLSAFIILLIAICATVLYFLTKKLIYNTPNNSFADDKPINQSYLKDFIWLAPSLLFILLISTKQILELLHYSSAFFNTITNYIFPYN